MASLRVEVVRALPGGAEVLELELPAGATLADALAAFARARGEPPPDPSMAGVHGRRVGPQTALADGDRVELYRPLLIDPKEARRRRASRRTTPSRRARP